MKFLLTFLMQRDAMPDPGLSQRCFTEMNAFVSELSRRGKLHFDSQLCDESQAARVSLSAGQPLVEDGPFAEPAETSGGFFILEVADRNEALAIARRCPHLQVGRVELRRLNESDQNVYT